MIGDSTHNTQNFLCQITMTAQYELWIRLQGHWFGTQLVTWSHGLGHIHLILGCAQVHQQGAERWCRYIIWNLNMKTVLPCFLSPITSIQSDSFFADMANPAPSCYLSSCPLSLLLLFPCPILFPFHPLPIPATFHYSTLTGTFASAGMHRMLCPSHHLFTTRPGVHPVA